MWPFSRSKEELRFLDWTPVHIGVQEVVLMRGKWLISDGGDLSSLKELGIVRNVDYKLIVELHQSDDISCIICQNNPNGQSESKNTFDLVIDSGQIVLLNAGYIESYNQDLLFNIVSESRSTYSNTVGVIGQIPKQRNAVCLVINPPFGDDVYPITISESLHELCQVSIGYNNHA